MSSPKPLAILCHTLPPYRLHRHGRIAAEIAEIRLLTINTHHDATRDWSTTDHDAIGLVDMTHGEKMPGGPSLGSWLRERKRGGEIIDFLRQQQVAAVIVNGYNDAGRRRTIRWCHQQGIPCFLWADSNIASDRTKTGWKQTIKQWMVPRMVRLATGCFACGRLGRQFWEHYGAKPEQIFISPYEPDYSLIHNQPEAAIAETAVKHRLDPDRKRLLFSGRLTAVKRVDLLIEAFIAVADDRPDWDLVIVGDGELKDSLQAKLPEHLRSRVIWTGFVSDQSELSRLYRASHVLMLPSSFEPWALVVNEAVAAGMAVVATDVVGAAAELVRDGVNGHIVPVDDLPALIAATQSVTDAANTGRMRAASNDVLAAWQREGDPVEGIRQALRYAGVLDA